MTISGDTTFYIYIYALGFHVLKIKLVTVHMLMKQFQFPYKTTLVLLKILYKMKLVIKYINN